MSEKIKSIIIYYVCENNRCPDLLRDGLRTVEISWAFNGIYPQSIQNCPACGIRMKVTTEGPAKKLRKP